MNHGLTDAAAAGQPKALLALWKVVVIPNPYGNALATLRISATYLNGKTRTLAPSFRTREALDKYVARFLPDFCRKEEVQD